MGQPTAGPEDEGKSATSEKARPRKAVQCISNTPEDAGRSFATLATSPELAAYRVIQGAEGKSAIAEGMDVPDLMDVLREQASAVNSGDMGRPVAMLMNQATALQSLFARLIEKAMGSELLSQYEVQMRMALRAQSQCRTTLETLAAIKNR